MCFSGVCCSEDGALTSRAVQWSWQKNIANNNSYIPRPKQSCFHVGSMQYIRPVRRLCKVGQHCVNTVNIK